ncbi:MAG: glutamate 5-kinase, partial [Bacteroidales bacterium]
MYRYKRVTIKIGSNVLTGKDGMLNISRMDSLVSQIAELHKNGVEVILVSSGAVASGRGELHIEKKLDAVKAHQLFSAVGQVKLLNNYYELFKTLGINCGQVLTTKEDFSTRRLYLNQKQCIEVMLENGVIPIVNENDTVAVTE